MNIIISNSSQDPIYQQIITRIKNLIIIGELTEGYPLPSIRNLAKELQISVITTKRAYEELERDGFIETVAGKGSFVSAKNKEFLREKRLRDIEEKLVDAISAAKSIDISLNQLIEMVSLFYEEEK